jgi:hypothetical protein
MPSFDFKRLNRTILIYRFVQALLIILLMAVVYWFQISFTQIGTPEKFFTSIKFTVIIQLLLFYPIYRLALRDVTVVIDGCDTKLSTEAADALRKKRLLGDMWKFSGVAFFVAFVTMVPDAKKASGATQILAITLFSFLLMCLMYFQCFNFSAKKRMKQGD